MPLFIRLLSLVLRAFPLNPIVKEFSICLNRFGFGGDIEMATFLSNN